MWPFLRCIPKPKVRQHHPDRQGACTQKPTTVAPTSSASIRQCTQGAPSSQPTTVAPTVSTAHHKSSYHADEYSQPGPLSRLLAASTAATISMSLLCSGYSSSQVLPLPPLAHVEQTYEAQVQRLHHQRPVSNLPSRDEAAALNLLLDRDLFSADAWLGMQHLAQYAEYVEQLSAAGVEQGPTCQDCTANRLMLEKVSGQLHTKGARMYT